jgi:outer membrane protein assembly factor BamA
LYPPSPPRYADGGYNALYYGGKFVFDSRDKKPKPQSGARVALEGTPYADFSHRPGNSWVSYSGTAAGFVDLTGTARVLSLTIATIFVDPMTGRGDQIPFNELAQLGGVGFMRGYIPSRLIDRSAAVATLGYEWPVWSFLDATLQASTGNVFGPHLEGIELGKLRLSSGVGLRTNRSPESQVEVFMGFGSDPFDTGFRISSFRFAIGATHGF